MLNKTILYISIYIPLVGTGIGFYAVTIFVLFVKRYDSILGTKFFNMHIVLGINEIFEVVIHY
jgi:hypothetical protein